MARPRLLDLFCGAGGAAMGYHRAGFDVVGVDHRPQPRFPFEFVQADALEYFAEHGGEFIAVHASPPCQAFTQMSARYRGKGGKADSRPDLLTPTLQALRGGGMAWVVENVVGARRLMNPTLSLHGGMFGLGVYRPRLFESNVLLMAPKARKPVGPIGVYGDRPDGRRTWSFRNNGNYGGKSEIRAARSIEEARAAMGIDWMEWSEIREAIPPAYTELIGRQLIAAVALAA